MKGESLYELGKETSRDRVGKALEIREGPTIKRGKCLAYFLKEIGLQSLPL